MSDFLIYLFLVAEVEKDFENQSVFAFAPEVICCGSTKVFWLEASFLHLVGYEESYSVLVDEEENASETESHLVESGEATDCEMVKVIFFGRCCVDLWHQILP